MEKPSYNVVCAIIKNNNQILCCKRDNKGECANKWEFPGGKIEPNETKEEALLREIKEELDCNIKIENYLTKVEHEYQTFKVSLHVYLCSLIDKEFKMIVHKELRWVDIKNLKELDFAEADYKFLDLIV